MAEDKRRNSEGAEEWKGDESVEVMRHLDEDEQLDPETQSVASGITW